MPHPTSIVWFRQDLRLDDNPALTAAVSRGGPVIPVFIWDPGAEGEWPPGAASRCWLHWSLGRLDAALRAVGSRLVVRTGNTLATLRELVAECSVDAVFWNRRYEPAAIEVEREVEAALRGKPLGANSFNSSLLFEPWTLQTKAGGPYKVFTPFYRACLSLPGPDAPGPAPKQVAPPARWPKSLALDSLALLPEEPWYRSIEREWDCGESATRTRLDAFFRQTLAGYAGSRDKPDVAGTSRFSPHLHFGELSPRRVWHRLQQVLDGKGPRSLHKAAEAFRRQLVWREFAYHLLFHFPRTPTTSFREAFGQFPWHDDRQSLGAWQRGRTGYPVIDAGMRELWQTGWMHNRVRMLVGSFLVKDLFIPWQAGARWFWDTLVDADLANNTLGWQWVAGCGADAAPYFRIFNPVGQGERFDPEGPYVRRWVPELAGVPKKWIHKPWLAPQAVLREAGVTLGASYPRPLVNHDEARKRALDVYRKSKRARR